MPLISYPESDNCPLYSSVLFLLFYHHDTDECDRDFCWPGMLKANIFGLYPVYIVCAAVSLLCLPDPQLG